MDNEVEKLEWTVDRRFGSELEINAFDGKSRPEGKELPSGIEQVGEVVRAATGSVVNIRPWGYNHNNDDYIVKPDSSCGIEVCSPVLKGSGGLEQIIRVARSFRDSHLIQSDERCSYHVHVNVHDCTAAEVASIAAHWVKCEAVFLDSVPPPRKRSRYCQMIGASDMFDVRDTVSPAIMAKRVGGCKYYTLNNWHMAQGLRSTIEFRIAENEACCDPMFVKCWTKLVVHFCERAKRYPMPGPYKPGDPWSSLCWLDPKDVFRLLGFFPGQYDLSPGLKQVRAWFLARILKHGQRYVGNIFSEIGRRVARRESEEMAQELGDINESCLYPENLDYALYDESLRR